MTAGRSVGAEQGQGREHLQDPFEQHPTALTWRSRCSCGFAGHWRANPDRAQDDVVAHWVGDDRQGTRLGRIA